jgi:YidC/Oxa1 family membrane protein insertase
MQRTLFMLMPLVFVFVIARFPAGLVLYWVTTNLWTVGQGLITRRLIPKTPAPSLFERRTSRTPPKGAQEGEGEGDGDGNGARRPPRPPKPAPGVSQPPRKVRRKKKAGRR